MNKLTPKDLKRGREALLATIAGFGSQPFRRSDVVKQLLPTRRSNLADRMRVDDIASAVMKEAAAEVKIVRSGHLHWMRASTTRVLLDGTQIAELPSPIEIKISTKVPDKWLLVDRETGEVWQSGQDGKLKRAQESITKAIGKAIR